MNSFRIIIIAIIVCCSGCGGGSMGTGVKKLGRGTDLPTEFPPSYSWLRFMGDGCEANVGKEHINFTLMSEFGVATTAHEKTCAFVVPMQTQTLKMKWSKVHKPQEFRYKLESVSCRNDVVQLLEEGTANAELGLIEFAPLNVQNAKLKLKIATSAQGTLDFELRSDRKDQCF